MKNKKTFSVDGETLSTHDIQKSILTVYDRIITDSAIIPTGSYSRELGSYTSFRRLPFEPSRHPYKGI